MELSSASQSQNDTRSKVDLLLQQFFTKTAQIIVQSRLRLDGQNLKVNKWFNLELEDREPLREELKFWKGQLTSSMQAPPLIVDILLDISSLEEQQHILLTSTQTGRRHRIPPESLIYTDPSGNSLKKQKILLETWQLTLSPDITDEVLELPTVYKRCIVFFRCLYAFVRLMPAFKLGLNRRENQQTKLSYRVGTTRDSSPLVCGLDELHTSLDLGMGITESTFDSVETPLGVFHLHSTYRLECDFHIESPEMPFKRNIDVEPGFFRHQEIARRLSAQQEIISQPSDSFYKKVDIETPTSPKFRPGSLPRSISRTTREGINIPGRSNHLKSYGNSYSVSPDSNRGLLNSVRMNSVRSAGSNLLYTPPQTDMNLNFERRDRSETYEDPPFSTSNPLSNQIGPKKYIVDTFYGVSPPFEIAQSSGTNTSLTIHKKNSLIFPSSPVPMQFSPPGHMQFNSSSLIHPFLRKGPSMSTNSYSSQEVTEVENFLITLEQSQLRRITLGGEEPVQESILTGTKSATPSTVIYINQALDQFRNLNKPKVNLEVIPKDKLNELSRLSDSHELEQPKHIPISDSLSVTESLNIQDRGGRARRGRQRSSTTDWTPPREPLNIYDGLVKNLSRSEVKKKEKNCQDEDELLFNMSLME